MDVKLVKAFLGKPVYYDTGQMNFEGCRRGGRAAKTRTNFKSQARGLFFRIFLCANRMQCHVVSSLRMKMPENCLTPTALLKLHQSK